MLTGTVVDKSLTTLVLNVGGVGFECGVSVLTASVLPAPGSDEVCVVYTRLQVREDGMALYAFSSREERDVYDKLVAVSGVGPKLALSVLSTFTPAALRDVVAAGDEKRMSSVPGVGKKMASRMILELKDALKTSLLGETSVLPGMGDTGASASGLDETKAALLSMGFTTAECDLALKGYDGDMNDTSSAVKYALKRLGSSL